VFRATTISSVISVNRLVEIGCMWITLGLRRDRKRERYCYCYCYCYCRQYVAEQTLDDSLVQSRLSFA
jgi:hypothetical protein